MSTDIYISYSDQEQNPHINLLQQKGYLVERESLPIGDYIISNGVQQVIIECKNKTDLLSSKISDDRHLETQIKELSRFEFSMIAIVGFLEEEFEKILQSISQYNHDKIPDQYRWAINLAKYYPQSVSSIKTSIGIRRIRNGYRPGVMVYTDSVDFQRGMLYIIKLLQENRLYYSDESPEMLRKMRETMGGDSLRASRIASLTGIDGIGTKTAMLLASHFNYNLHRLINASDEELLKINGVGTKTLENIRRFYEDVDIVEEETPTTENIPQPEVYLSGDQKSLVDLL